MQKLGCHVIQYDTRHLILFGSEKTANNKLMFHFYFIICPSSTANSEHFVYVLQNYNITIIY